MTKARDIASAAPAPSTVSATELGYVDGVTSAIQTQLDAKTAKSTLTTTGDIYYASGANTPARLGIGSTGNVLTVASGIPSWAAPAGGGGKVLQVVFGSTSTDTTTSTSTFVDTNLTATITPTLATSKILVMFSQNGVGKTTNNTAVMHRLLRGATVIANTERFGGLTNTTATSFIGSISAHYLDEPATTSATTYKTQFASQNNQATIYAQATEASISALSTMILMEIGA
jgi:hypothetical protein